MENENFTIEKGVLLKYKNTLYPSTEIPVGVIKIAPHSFAGNPSLGRVIIPEGVTEIEEMAFNIAIHLKRVDFPKSIKKIGANAFNGTDLKKVTIAKDAEVADNAFPPTCEVTRK